jgi:protocatechuate 3,4-dioxygenase beta subunit
MMDSDDDTVGRVLTRREVLKLLGWTGAAVLTGCTPGLARVTIDPSGTVAASATATSGVLSGSATGVALPACVVRPESTEGPYFVDEGLNRSDIRSDPATGEIRPGLPLELIFRVMRVGAEGCLTLAGAIVDVWHCDALGVYSDVADPGFDTSGQKFLRGFQQTDGDGVARFLTIYPGWYPGRTVHIHFRSPAADGSFYDFTSQLYFDDSLSDSVFTSSPYAAKGERGTRNQDDGIFRDGGEQLMLAPSPIAEGYSATFDIGLQLS